MGSAIMANKKSLGSSPIGFQTTDGTMGFIPDLGVSESSQKKKSATATSKSQSSPSTTSNATNRYKGKEKEKKIVSYNLEIGLIKKVKSIAQQKNMYYSSLVSKALKRWIAENS